MQCKGAYRNRYGHRLYHQKQEGTGMKRYFIILMALVFMVVCLPVQGNAAPAEVAAKVRC